MLVCIYSRVGISLILAAIHTAHTEQTHSDAASCHGLRTRRDSYSCVWNWLASWPQASHSLTLSLLIPSVNIGWMILAWSFPSEAYWKGFLKDHLCLLDKTKILLCRCQDSTLSPRIWQKRAIFKDCPEPYMACDGLRKECPGTSVTTGFLSDNGSTPEQKSWLYSALHPILHWGVREKCRNRCFRGLQSTEERKRLPGCLICALSIIKLLRIQLW